MNKQVLAPDASDTKAQLARSAVAWLQLTRLTTALLDTEFGAIDGDPKWLRDARAALDANQKVGFQWLHALPDIATSVVQPFIRYASVFEAFAAIAPVNDDPASIERLTAMLKALSGTIDAILEQIDEGTKEIGAVASAFAAVHDAMQSAGDEARAANAENQSKLLESAATVATLQGKIEALGDDISGSVVSGGESIVENQVELVFEIAMGELEIPFLGVGLVVLSVGVDVIEGIESSVEIEGALDELNEAMKDEAAEMQAAIALQGAMTAFQRLAILYAEAKAPAPDLKAIWEGQRDVVDTLIDGLENGGMQPKSMTTFHLLGRAADEWRTLQEFAVPLLALKPAKTRSTKLTVSGTESHGTQ